MNEQEPKLLEIFWSEAQQRGVWTELEQLWRAALDAVEPRDFVADVSQRNAAIDRVFDEIDSIVRLSSGVMLLDLEDSKRTSILFKEPLVEGVSIEQEQK